MTLDADVREERRRKRRLARKDGPYTLTNPGYVIADYLISRDLPGRPWVPMELVVNSPTTYGLTDTKTGRFNADWMKARGVTALNSEYYREIVEVYPRKSFCQGKKLFNWTDEFGRPVAGYGTIIFEGNTTPYDGVGPQWSVFSLDFSSADNRAKLSLAQRITEEYRKFQGGVFLRELRETISFIRHPAKKLWKLTEDYVSNVRKRVRKIPPHKLSERGELVRELWLEFSFGAGPLIQDVKDLASFAGELAVRKGRELEGLRSIRSKREYVSATSVNFTNLSLPMPNTYGWYEYGQEKRNLEEVWVQYTAQCSRKLLYPENDLQALVQLSGFSLREWVPTLWNCIPWSFVADYFTNINDVLEFYATDFSSVVGLSKSVKRKQTQYFVSTGDIAKTALNWGTTWQQSDLGALTRVRATFQRTIVDPVTLDVRFEFQTPSSAKKLFNLAMLWSSVWNANLNLRH